MSQPNNQLGAVGVSPPHEQAYRYLVREGHSRTAREVAEALGLSVRAARDLLRVLEDKALVTRVPTRPPGYSASPPELALETLVTRRREELAQIRVVAKELQDQYREAASDGTAADLVEVIVGRERSMRYFMHLVHTAKFQFDSLTKPPYVAVDDPNDVLRAEGAGIRRGVRSRSVYESGALDESLTLAVAEHSLAMGEQARAVANVPMKLALFDGRAGFVPLKVDEPGLGALVVHPSPLLDALIALFESIWERAVPLQSLRDGGPPDELSERAQQVLLLMSAGLKDESIARVTGMSRRTVQKHVTATMAMLGARTRFQAALLARERGWVGSALANPEQAPVISD
ncbi:LuxR C-terminal-related transcriptional regulator [Rugosimonospora acidiphila]|uniref:LuxR C-terminal-related transcriptional regulator n=1 Tax=Rugosimonospora acidiphila TaxID=556531 RepID=UPI0031E9619B